MLRSAVVETHISRLFFVDDHVYKANKAVDLGFLDHRSLEARARACEQELTVNRRFAPDVYEGSAALIGVDGRTCEHFVVMRRLPEERRLTTLLHSPEAADRIREVARAVAAFHGVAPTSAEIDRCGASVNVAQNWSDNFRELRGFGDVVLPPADLARAEHLAHRFLAGRERLFAARVESGKVRDGHGDLLADDIFCLPDGPRILDALAFRDDLRCGDVLLDAAFLAMDLERLGHLALGARFLNWYREFSGETYPDALADHYVAYRALVRAKVQAIRWTQTDDPDAVTDARALLALTLRRLERGRVRLVLVGGLPGTGKSTLAQELAAQTGWLVLSSDEVRKDFAGIPHEQSAGASYGEGLYRPEVRGTVYAHLLARAQELLELGESVILDASWSQAPHRAMAREVASATFSDLTELRCVAPQDVAERRLARRGPTPAHGSDATVEVARRMAEAAEPWPTANVIHTTGTLNETLRSAMAACGADPVPTTRRAHDEAPRSGTPDSPVPRHERTI